MTNLYQQFSLSFERHAHQVALVTPQQNLTYAEIQQATAQIANGLMALGLQPGARVVVQVEKSLQAVLLYLACLRAGLIYVPLNPAYTLVELQYFITDAKPSLLVADERYAAPLQSLCQQSACQLATLNADGSGSWVKLYQTQAMNQPMVARQADDVAVIIYTSGTTGRPKGALLTHQGLGLNAKALNQSWGITADDKLLHLLPLFHVHGLLFACHTLLLAGGQLILLPKFEIDGFFKYLPAATLFMGVPTYYTRLLNDARLTQAACQHMRLFISGSAPLLATTFKAFQVRTGQTILERYGMSETGINTTNPLIGERKLATVGKALPGLSLRIVNEQQQPVAVNEIGIIQIKSPYLFKGYWQNPQATAAAMTPDGYFDTGDMGYLDVDNYLTIVGRAKDMIISGGLNIYPQELEMSLNNLAGVIESAVIGVPHPDYGEGVIAILAVNTVAELTEQQVLDFMRQQHAGFKCPKRVMFVRALPKNALGKVQKALLRQEYAEIFSAA